MNVETGFMGEMDEVRKRAKQGEKIIPATIIPAQPARPVPQMYGPRKPLREVRAELQAEAAEQ